MKQGDTITTKDGKELIAVPHISNALCTGCFFFDSKGTCTKKEKIEGKMIPCWDNNGKQLIFEDKQIMKTINNLTVTVTYTVGIGNIKVPKEVYNDLMKHYDAWLKEVPEDSIAAEWLADNIKERDAMDWRYEIDNLK